MVFYSGYWNFEWGKGVWNGKKTKRMKNEEFESRGFVEEKKEEDNFQFLNE